MVAVLSDNQFFATRRCDVAAAARLRAGAPERLHPSVYRRRRLMVAGLLLLLVATVLIAAQSTLASTGGGPLTTTGAAATAGSMTPADAAIWVVRPGDTLWSIARTLDPNGDIRPLVDRLSAEVGNNPIYPGQTIVLPGGSGNQ